MTNLPTFREDRSVAIRRMLRDEVVGEPKRGASLRRKTGAVSVAVAGLIAIGGGTTAWALSSHVFYTPSATEGGPATPAPDAAWPKNAHGQTYGVQGNSGRAPDLVLVEATNGRTGYAYSRELEQAEGLEFTSPEKALQWQKDNQGKIFHVKVYMSDGTTVIGQFDVGPVGG